MRPVIWYTRENPISLDGADIVHLPLMATRFQELNSEQKSLLDSMDFLIFTSTNAAKFFFAQVKQTNAKLIAIGEATAAALPRVDLISPPPFNSEALLKIWQPIGVKIGIIAAAGGRDLLQKSLQKQNPITIFHVYERYNPTPILPPNLPFPDLITIASEQTLKNLLAITPQNLLKLLQSQTYIAALSLRVAQCAQHYGFLAISATESNEKALFQRVFSWWLTDRSFK